MNQDKRKDGIMTTRVATIGGDEYAVDEYGRAKYKILRYRINSADVIPNADGTYSIPSIKAPKDSYWAYTRDTADLYIYDEDKKAWLMQ